MNPATRGNEDNANAPVLYIAIELSNKNVHMLSYGSYDGDNSKLNLIIKAHEQISARASCELEALDRAALFPPG